MTKTPQEISAEVDNLIAAALAPFGERFAYVLLLTERDSTPPAETRFHMIFNGYAPGPDRGAPAYLRQSRQAIAHVLKMALSVTRRPFHGEG